MRSFIMGLALWVWDSICAWATFWFIEQWSNYQRYEVESWGYRTTVIRSCLTLFFGDVMFPSSDIRNIIACSEVPEKSTVENKFLKKIGDWRLFAQWWSTWTLERDILRSGLNLDANNILNSCWLFFLEQINYISFNCEAAAILPVSHGCSEN